MDGDNDAMSGTDAGTAGGEGQQGSGQSSAPENNGGAGDGQQQGDQQRVSVGAGDAGGEGGTATNILEPHELSLLETMGIGAQRVQAAVTSMGAEAAKAWLGELVNERYAHYGQLGGQQQGQGQQFQQQPQQGQQQPQGTW